MTTPMGGGSMAKQPEDTHTLELPLCAPESISVTKRAPGRPRDPDAMTNAERQQRWRDKQKRSKRISMPSPKYQCPMTGKTWTGRGLMPKWLSILVHDQGHPLCLYLVRR